MARERPGRARSTVVRIAITATVAGPSPCTEGSGNWSKNVMVRSVGGRKLRVGFQGGAGRACRPGVRKPAPGGRKVIVPRASALVLRDAARPHEVAAPTKWDGDAVAGACARAGGVTRRTLSWRIPPGVDHLTMFPTR